MTNGSNKIIVRKGSLVKDLFHPMGDLDEILKIERQSYDDPWDENTFRYFLKFPGSGSLVAESDGNIVAFLLFEIQDSYVNLVSVAVNPEFRRKKFGTLLIKELKTSCLAGCNRIYCTVSDKNLGAHLFLSKFGFKAIATRKDFYDSGHDAYEFMYSVRKQRKKAAKKDLSNE